MEETKIISNIFWARIMSHKAMIECIWYINRHAHTVDLLCQCFPTVMGSAEPHTCMVVPQPVHKELHRTIYTAQTHAWSPIRCYILRLFNCQQSVAYPLDVWIIWKFISALFSTCHMGILIYCTKLYELLLATEEFSEKMQLLTFSCCLFLCICISLLMLFFALGHGCWKVVQDMVWHPRRP